MGYGYLLMDNILLTGATGFLGWSFVAEAKEHSYTLLLRRSDINFPPKHRVFIAKKCWGEELRSVWDQVQPSAVIHCGAMADPRACESDPELSRQTNVNWPVELAELAAKRGLPMAHFSSDLVFDGTTPMYGEAEPCRPLSIYGAQKAEAEQRVAEVHPGAWLLRLPLLYGECGPWSGNGMKSLLERWSAREKTPLFVDEFRTPARTRRIARYVLDHLGDFSGLMYLGGGERLSRYEMGRLLAHSSDLSEEYIVASRQAELEHLGQRPADVSLNSELAVKRGYLHLSFKRELEDITANGGWIRQNFI